MSSITKLAQTDIPESALNVLKRSRVKDIKIFGRRGPKDASFTIKELRELLNLENCSVSTTIPEDESTNISAILGKLERPKKRILQLMLERRFPKNVNGQKNCEIKFYQKPISIEKDKTGRIKSVCMENSLTGEITNVPCGLLIYAIGYENVVLPGLPAKDNKLLLKDWCRVDCEDSKVYATGWCAHSPTGVIAQTQGQAVAVSDEISKELQNYSKSGNKNGSLHRLEARNVSYLTFEDWKYVDECEKMMGRILGKLKEKIHNVSEFIRLGR